MTIGQLIKNTETGRLGMIKSFLVENRAVVTRCNEQGVPTKERTRTLWGWQNGPGIWITSLDKWEPLATVYEIIKADHDEKHGWKQEALI